MKVLVSNSISIDGFICGPNHYEDWISAADEKYFLSECKIADVILLGANTFDSNTGLFPVLPKEHIVFTKSAGDRTSQDYITFSNQDPADYVRANTDKNIIVAGGGLLNAYLLEEGVVTDITICVHPIILGEGVRQFEKSTFADKTELVKVSEKDIGDGVVRIHYQIA